MKSGISLFYLFIVLAPICSTAQQNEEAENYNSCGAYTRDKIELLLSSSSAQLLELYGKKSVDSVSALVKHAQKLYDSGALLIQAEEAPFVKDTTALANKLRAIFRNSDTAADSIDALTQWVGSSVINSEHNPELYKVPAEEIYQEITNQTAAGDAGNFADVLCKLAVTFPGWGVPVRFDAVIAVGDSSNNESLKHSFVGFVRADGEVWCIADPFLGGVVRHLTKGQALAYDSIRALLRTPSLLQMINVKPLEYSMLSSTACVFSILVRSRTAPAYIVPHGAEVGYVRAQWISPAEKNYYMHGIYSFIWEKPRFAGNTFYNFYKIPKYAVLYNSDRVIADGLQKKYSLQVDFQ